MALDIRFNGIKPEQKCYRYSIQNNAENDKVFFILQSEISNIVSLKDLSKYDVYLKCESAGKEYLDKIKVDCFYVSETNAISIPFVLPLKTTQYRNIGFQIQFQDANSNLIAQTEIVGMELCGTIKADEEIPSKYPSELIRIENELTQQGEELANHEQRIETLEQNVPYTEKEIIVSDDVDSFENENGVDKLVRELESDGSVEKTFLIDKIYHEETKIEANPTLEEDNTPLSNPQDIIDDLGEENFKNVFGNNAYIDYVGDIVSKYNDILGNKTFSISFGLQGQLFFNNCGNKPITIVFGKNYHFNEHGEKVLSPYSSLVRLVCKEYDGEEIAIDSEYNEITIHAKDNGRIEIEIGGYPSPEEFVIYGFYTGTPAYTEYKKREIGKGGGGSAVSNVEIKKIYLTYKDRMSIRADFLGCVAETETGDEINFVNDSTRIFYNFETTIIDDKIEEEINNGRFVIRLDYPLKNKSQIEKANLTHPHNSTTRNGVGARGFKYRFNGENDNLIKTLIFIEPSDIKTNRYGEKYIHKRITLFDYINRLCNFSIGGFEPITLDWINNDNDGINFFETYLDQAFSCGIPHISQTNDNVWTDNTIFKGRAKTNFSLIGNFGYWNTNYVERGFINSAKLNPAFSCYSLFKLNYSGDIHLTSNYYVGKHKMKMFKFAGDNAYVIQTNSGNMGKQISHNAYMVARPRCAIVNDDFATSDYAFLKTYPQAEQQIRLYCKYMRDIRDMGVDLAPIFRTLITQK